MDNNIMQRATSTRQRKPIRSEKNESKLLRKM